MTYLRRGVWFGPGTDIVSFPVLLGTCPVAVTATINDHGAGGCVTEHANVLQRVHKKAQDHGKSNLAPSWA